MDRDNINREYRNADIERWQEMDFVLGYKINRSKNCQCDCGICEKGEGEYPKSFIWNGWHDGCKCYLTPIMKDADEMAKVTEAFLKGETYEPKGDIINTIPKSLIDYIKSHPECKNEDWYKANPKYFI